MNRRPYHAVYTIAICDLEPVAVQGLRSLLESTEGLAVVAADSNPEESMESVRALRPAALLIDKSFGLPVLAELLESLRAVRSPTAVIAWGAFLSEQEGLRLLKAGAAGLIPKSAPLTVLLACLRTVASGGTWIDETLPGLAARRLRSGNSTLTPREAQVKELVERGLKNKEIGSNLGISPGTVKIHLKHIFEKTGIHGRYGLAVSGLREKGLLSSIAAQCVQ